METTLSTNLIAANPNVPGGRPCVIGTTITVADADTDFLRLAAVKNHAEYL